MPAQTNQWEDLTPAHGIKVLGKEIARLNRSKRNALGTAGLILGMGAAGGSIGLVKFEWSFADKKQTEESIASLRGEIEIVKTELKSANEKLDALLRRRR
jgi:hypothetical protein